MSFITKLFKSPKRSRPTPNQPPPPVVVDGPSHPVMITNNNDMHVYPVGMSYWNRINNHGGDAYMRVALSIAERIQIFTVRKADLAVVDVEDMNIVNGGEQIYFSDTDHNKLYYLEGGMLWSINIKSKYKNLEWHVPGREIWQPHTSSDGRVHSAALKHDGQITSWGVSSDDNLLTFPVTGSPDECQITKKGRMFLIKQHEERNYVVDILNPANLRVVEDAAGALGHSDCGDDFAVGEENHQGTIIFWDLETLQHRSIGESRWNMGYVSVSGRKALVSYPQGDIVVINVDTKETQKVCDAPTQDQEYDNRVKANMCPLGQYAMWTSRNDGRLNAWIVRVP